MNRKYEIVAGQRFGQLTAIREIDPTKNSQTKRRWQFKCDCGGWVESQIYRVYESKRNCGCETAKGSILNTLFNRYKTFAKQRKIEFSLTKDQMTSLLTRNCYYCGVKPSQKKYSLAKTYFMYYNGLDRVNTKAGYSKANVVPCCWPCNKNKHSCGLAIAKKMVDFQLKGSPYF